MKFKFTAELIIFCSRSREGAWIEILCVCKYYSCVNTVAPARERGLKSKQKDFENKPNLVAPARERGLKSGRRLITVYSGSVAPARERGLKFSSTHASLSNLSRSREGAWIEILNQIYITKFNLSRSREGAWIEIACERRADQRQGASLPRGSVD